MRRPITQPDAAPPHRWFRLRERGILPSERPGCRGDSRHPADFDGSTDGSRTMNVRRAAAGAALAAATLSAVPATASADNPEDPANGIIPAGIYHITQHPDNTIGSP